MVSNTLQIGTATARAGETVWGDVEIPAMYVGQIEPPQLALVHGVHDGPTIFIGAGAHGNEYNGMEVIRQAALKLDPAKLSGTVILVPIQNQAAFLARSRRTPADNKDIDTCYPGDPTGSPTDALAHLILADIVTKADYGLDLHTATCGGTNSMHALVAPTPPEASAKARQLAENFGCRVIVELEAPAEGHLGESMGWNLDSNLFVQANLRGVPCPIIEFGEGGRLETGHVEAALRGVFNVLACLGMIDQPASSRPVPSPYIARESVAVRCATRGFLYAFIKPGDKIGEGQLLARVISIPSDVEEIHAPRDGVVVRLATNGVVVPGERIVVFATS